MIETTPQKPVRSDDERREGLRRTLQELEQREQETKAATAHAEAENLKRLGLLRNFRAAVDKVTVAPWLQGEQGFYELSYDLLGHIASLDPEKPTDALLIIELRNEIKNAVEKVANLQKLYRESGETGVLFSDEKVLLPLTQLSESIDRKYGVISPTEVPISPKPRVVVPSTLSYDQRSPMPQPVSDPVRDKRWASKLDTQNNSGSEETVAKPDDLSFNQAAWVGQVEKQPKRGLTATSIWRDVLKGFKKPGLVISDGESKALKRPGLVTSREDRDEKLA